MNIAEPLKKTVREYTPKMVADICGISVEQLTEAAHWFGTSPQVLSLYCQGLNQSSSGTAKSSDRYTLLSKYQP